MRTVRVIRELGEVDRYSWENGNAVHYAYLPQKEITYEYNSQLRPENFPFRVVNSFQPVGFDVISPLNLLYGKMNQNLPTRAYWYNVSDATDICAEYTFRYTLTGDYITGMTIEEKINPVNGATAENNTYEYEFIYNFVEVGQFTSINRGVAGLSFLELARDAILQFCVGARTEGRRELSSRCNRQAGYRLGELANYPGTSRRGHFARRRLLRE